MSSWVYIRSEPGLYTVGHYDPAGRWQSDSDHDDQRAAALRCAYLNGAAAGLTAAALDVLTERERQISQEGWSTAHDDEHSQGELRAAAGCYALEGSVSDRDSKFPRYELPDGTPRAWPFNAQQWKPKDRRRDLVRAGALILAELERLDRAASGAAA